MTLVVPGALLVLAMVAVIHGAIRATQAIVEARDMAEKAKMDATAALKVARDAMASADTAAGAALEAKTRLKETVKDVNAISRQTGVKRKVDRF